jgi:hypothetical protein
MRGDNRSGRAGEREESPASNPLEIFAESQNVQSKTRLKVCSSNDWATCRRAGRTCVFPLYLFISVHTRGHYTVWASVSLLVIALVC